MSTAEVWEVPLIQAAQRVAVVTGANRGIGREVVRQLAVDHGFVVVLGSRDRARPSPTRPACEPSPTTSGRRSVTWTS